MNASLSASPGDSLNASPGEKLLEIERVDVTYPGSGRRTKFKALHSVSLDIRPGETVGLVGESGSGKTTLGRAVLGLAPVTAGSIRLHGTEIAQANRAERRLLAKDLQVVFQDPYSSLNPSMSIEQILTEPLTSAGQSMEAAKAKVHTLLEQVGMPADAGSRRPREFSGGQRQRIAIARALALEPKLIVCDEPVSALDLTTQARVLELFLEIQERTGVAYLFISHDLSVIRYLSHRVAVMYNGEIVEWGDGDQVTSRPEHPYTNRLMMAAPVSNPDRQADRREKRRALLEPQP
jgi:ABC-type glutathione transport system ATPase component